MEYHDEVEYGYVSLFSGGGFGDVGVAHGCGVPLLACCELLEERAEILRRLFPDSGVHAGDVWNVGDALVADVRRRIGASRRPWLVLMSPPCQGMSSNGKGRIGVEVERGTRPDIDPRNRLLLPALRIAEALRPDWIIVENVKHMLHTHIPNEHNESEALLDLLRRRLDGYHVQERVLDAADYGVPQRRERLITICSRRRLAGLYHPPPSHGLQTGRPQVSLREALGHLAPLDALHSTSDAIDPLHCVPKWTPDQHFWMVHTPEGCTAFENDSCARCGGKQRDASAVDCAVCHRPLPRPTLCSRAWRCVACDELVPQKRSVCSKAHARPSDAAWVHERRLVRAFKTSYRRMHLDRPASTLTTNSGVISSDMKGHPTEHRVLSVREVLIVASLAGYPGYAPCWIEAERVLTELPHRLLRHIAGESIPPRLSQTIVDHLIRVDRCARLM